MASEERFAVIRKMLEDHGWRLTRISSSHHIFEKTGQSLISIPVHHGKVKPSYVRKIHKILEQTN